MTKIFLFLLQGIPESLGLIACSLALAKVKLRWRIILVVAFVFTLISCAVRELPVTFGLHTAVGILLVAVFITKTTRVTPSISFVCAFASFSVLALLEVLSYEMAEKLLQADINTIISDDLMWRMISIPQTVLLIIIALLIAKYRKPLEDMWKI